MSNKTEKQTEELNKLTNAEEKINDLQVKDSEQVKGGVELRAGNSVKQIAAGGQDTAG